MIRYSSVNKLGALVLVFAMSISALAALVPPASADPGESSSLVGNLSVPRAGAGTAMGLDGKIYLFGGYADTSWGGYLDTVIIFDPATGETTTGTNMPTAASLSVVARVANGSFYVIGGLNGVGALLTVQIYNPVSDSWSAGSPMPFAEFWATGGIGADSKIYVFGGRYTGNSTQILDPSTNRWSFGADVPTPRFGMASTLLSNGSFMLAGGALPGSFLITSLVHYYDPVADAWSAEVSMPDARTHGEIVAAGNGNAYYFGGQTVWNINAVPGQVYTSFNRLDLASGTSWESGPAQHLASFGLCVDSIGRVYVVGGFDGTSILTTVYEWVLYDISSPNELMIVSPTDGSIVSGNVVVLAGVANKEAGNTTPLMAIDFLVDGVLTETQMAGAGGSFLWDTTGLVDGSAHTLMVRGYLWSGGLTEDTVTVTVSSVSIAEIIISMEQELADLKTQLASDDANVTAISMQVAIMQAKLDGIISGMAAAGAEQSAAMVALNATLADLQLQLDAFQEQINRVEDKADTAGMYGIVTLVLVIIIIVLVALVLMMSRKKAP